ncbi:MAG: enoyl-CoA hydratase/isomerase family protein [Gammaproteobacteria bacterium]|nr:enoyl-CoA hydratase/isomerase family protein [Gammaproteobacteria bacterium]
MSVLESSQESGILILRLNRPEKHNCLNEDLLNALQYAFKDASSNSSIRAVLLIGNGKSFCAGADINQLAACHAISGYQFARFGQEVMDQIEQLNKPVVAALHGHVLGGGCELAMSAHLRFAHPETQLGQPEIKLGVIPGYGGTQRLTRLVGRSKALDLCLTGRFVDAQTALQYGLIDKIYAENLEQEALNYLKIMSEQPPHAVACILQSILEGENLPLDKALNLEALNFAMVCASDDKREGVAAFLEKRPANFTGN